MSQWLKALQQKPGDPGLITRTHGNVRWEHGLHGFPTASTGVIWHVTLPTYIMHTHNNNNKLQLIYCHIVFLNCVSGFCSSDRWELRAVRAVLRAGSSWAAQLKGPGSCRYTLSRGCYLASLYVCSNSFDFVQCIIYISLNSVPL